MRITRRQLRKIVQERIAHPRDGLGKNIADAEFPIVVGYNLRGQDQSEIAYNQDELDDILDDVANSGMPYSLDSLEDMEPGDRPVGSDIEQYAEGKIRITRRQLRQIIKEVYGSTAEMAEDGSYFRDVIVLSPEGDSVLVDGEEVYIEDVPQQLQLMGFPMTGNDPDNLIFALEEMMEHGPGELEVTYKNGVWSW